MPFDQFVQTAIALLGPTAIWLSQSRSVRFQRWACIVGLVSQPFWFLATWDSWQWGVFVVAVVCLLAWLKGLRVLAGTAPARRCGHRGAAAQRQAEVIKPGAYKGTCPGPPAERLISTLRYENQ